MVGLTVLLTNPLMSEVTCGKGVPAANNGEPIFGITNFVPLNNGSPSTLF